MSKFEKSTYKKINLTEGVLKAILGYMVKMKLKSVLKKADKALDNDPELKATLLDLQYQQDRAKDAMKDFCKEFPHLCK